AHGRHARSPVLADRRPRSRERLDRDPLVGRRRKEVTKPMADARRRSPFSRPPKDDGPRASFRQLLPYILEHRGTIVAVAILSVIAAALTLVQPVMIGEVIRHVEAQDPLGWLLYGLVAFVVVQSGVSAYQHYLLQ